MMCNRGSFFERVCISIKRNTSDVQCGFLLVWRALPFAQVS